MSNTVMSGSFLRDVPFRNQPWVYVCVLIGLVIYGYARQNDTKPFLALCISIIAGVLCGLVAWYLFPFL